MSILDRLRQLSSAEEFFEALGVEYDPAVVNVARLHILRRMGEYLRRDAPDDADEETARALCKAHLEKAYDDFVKSSPIAERVFKVHKDAIKPAAPAPRQLISLSALPPGRSQS